MGAEQLVQERVGDHFDRPGDAADAQDGAGAGFALQVGEAEEHPEGLAEAGEAEGQGDELGGEAEASEVDARVLGDGSDCVQGLVLVRFVRVERWNILAV